MTLASTLLWTACSTAWISEAEQIVAVLLPGLANVLTLVATLRGSAITAKELANIQRAGQQTESDLQLLQSLISQYDRADAQGRPGLLGKVEAEAVAAQTDLNGVLAAVQVKDAATQAKISAVIGVLLTEVQSLAAILPVVSGSEPQPRTMVAGQQRKQRSPLGAAAFANLYNSVITAKTSDAALDRVTAGLKVHSPGIVRRWLHLSTK